MKFPIFGATDDAPSASANAFTYVGASFVGTSWNGTENTRQIPLSEAVTVTDLKVIVDTAPGSGKSRVFALRQNGASTSASVTIADTATSATWSGSVALSADDLVGLLTTPSGTPTAPGKVYWHMFWTVAGQKFLVLGGNYADLDVAALRYTNPFGSSTYAATAGAQDVVFPTGGNFTKLTAAASGAPGAGKSFAVSLRVNNTTDFLTATIADTATLASATGSQAMVAADTLQLKTVPAGTPTTAKLGWCATFEPTVDGESVHGFGHATASSVTVVNYEQLQGTGALAWTATESNVYLKLPAGTLKKLYCRCSTAPGAASDRIFMVRKNDADTALTATIAGLATTANDAVNTAVFAADDRLTLKHTPNATINPASANLHLGYVIATDQPAAATHRNLPLMGVG